MKIYLALAIAAIAAVVGYISSLYLGNDNPVEESCEQVIKDQINVEIDISPMASITGTIIGMNKSITGMMIGLKDDNDPNAPKPV